MADTITEDYPTVYGWTAKVPTLESPVDIPDSFRKFADSIPEDIPIATDQGSDYIIDATHLQNIIVNDAQAQTGWEITAGLDIGFQFSVWPDPDDINVSIILQSSDDSESFYPTEIVNRLAIITKISATEWIVSQ